MCGGMQSGRIRSTKTERSNLVWAWPTSSEHEEETGITVEAKTSETGGQMKKD